VLAGALLLSADLWNLLLEVIVSGSKSFSEFAVATSWTVLSTMYLLGSMLLLVALVGLYARQSEAAGALGLVGFLAALVGTGLLVGSFWTQAFVVASSATEAPAFLDAEEIAGPLDMGFMLSGIVVPLGRVLFGMTTLRARGRSYVDPGSRSVRNDSPVSYRLIDSYLSRRSVTGPSFVSATSIIAPKRPVFTELTPEARRLSQK